MKRLLLLTSLFGLMYSLQGCEKEQEIIESSIIEEQVNFCEDNFVGPLTLEQEKECGIETITITLTFPIGSFDPRIKTGLFGRPYTEEIIIKTSNRNDE